MDVFNAARELLERIKASLSFMKTQKATKGTNITMQTATLQLIGGRKEISRAIAIDRSLSELILTAEMKYL